MGAGSELPKRLVTFVAAETVSGREAGLRGSLVIKVDDKETNGEGGAPSTTVDGEASNGAAALARSDSDNLDVAQADALSLQKDKIGTDLARRMDELAALEEEAQSQTDPVKKALLLAQARMEANALKKQAQNSSDLGAKVRAGITL